MSPADLLAIHIRAANPGPLWDEERAQECRADRLALLEEVASLQREVEDLRRSWMAPGDEVR